MDALVEFEYTAEQEDELTLKVGDIITNVQTTDGGWWTGELSGKKGMFPENFVKLVKMREPAPIKTEEKREAVQRKSVRELANKFKDNMHVGGPLKKKEKQKRCKVLFEYKKDNDDELELAVGDIVDFHRQVEDGWWEGSVNGKQGVFPSNFVEMLEETASPDEGSPPSGEEKEKAAADTQNKDSDFQSIKGKKVVGVGLGNIFDGGPIKLRAVTENSKKEDTPKPVRQEDSGPLPDATVREKQNTTELAVVRFSYAAEQPDELSLEEGQIVHIIERELEDEGWWKGEINGKVGIFPDNFVALLPNDETNKPKTSLPSTGANNKIGLPKLPEKTPPGDTSHEKIKTETQVPFVGKKPQVPPPNIKKPASQKPVELKPEPPIPHPLTNSVKEKSSARENHTEHHSSLGSTHFDDIEPASQKLTHLTYGRAQGPKKRPPSSVIILNEGEKDETPEEIKSNHVSVPEKQQSRFPERPDKPLPVLPPKDYRHQSQPSSQTEQLPATPQTSAVISQRDKESHSSTPPPRPPEPVKVPLTHSVSASNVQINKLIEHLQQELHDLKANSVSKTMFSELRVQHEKLKLEFESLKKNHFVKIRDLTNEVDEEKKLRMTTQVEIERVKKLLSETNV